ncbi:MAG: GNAT family N-acetyltransferase, partial [Sinomicrobium sp.]|nr:GNAT family N-acetyltransferase [Sinomicrobium sp.]
ACHERHWADPYLLVLDGIEVGYGAVKGKDALKDRDAVFECYILPAYRKWSSELFAALIQISGARYIECQTNDAFLTALLYEFARNVYSDTVLFAESMTTTFLQPGVLFRRRKEDDDVFGKSRDDAGQYVLEKKGEIVADGGFLTHYNLPFADLYMEVKPECRERGLGTFMLQEVKKECYRAGRVPAARCNMNNRASKATLIKAGFRVCGFMLCGEVKREG